MAGVVMKDVVKRYGGVQVIHGIDLEIENGEFCVFVGPSGCGKSTLLRMIAGLEETTEGSMSIGDRDVTRMDPAERGVAMVFQTYALYPHMTVRDNMGFGLKMNGYPKAEIAQKVAEATRILKLEEYLDRKPAALSGGQRQRVSIGRAIVRGPEVFLFDEPLSNLDAELRVEMRVEIARLHKEIGATMVYVTHDQVEAMTLADKIVVLRKGRIEQVGAPLDLYRYALPVTPPEDGRDITLGIRPEHIEIDPQGKGFTVEMTEALGGVSYVHLLSDTGAKIIVEERGDDRSREGAQVGVKIPPERAMLFDANTEQRLR